MNAPTKGDLLQNIAENSCAGAGNGTPHSASLGKETWQPRFWANERHVAMVFASTEELDAAIDWLWAVPEMRDLPRVHVGENTMVVPAQAAACFAKKGFTFTVSAVASTGDLTSEEANRIRAGR